MLGNFQQSHLRIELAATGATIRQHLVSPVNLRQWLFPTQFDFNSDESLTAKVVFRSTTGFIAIEHQVEWVGEQGIRILLSHSIDGYQEWSWGDGWVQSRLEGISLLPLNLIQTANLLRLKATVSAPKTAES